MTRRRLRPIALLLLALATGLPAAALAVRDDHSAATDSPEARPAPRYLIAVLLDPERLAVVDLDTGRRVERRLPGGTLCYSKMLAIGGRIIYTLADEHGRRAVSLPLSLQGPPRSLGRADTIVSSAMPGRVWLGAMDLKRGGLRALREVTLDGRVTARVRHPTPGSTLLGAVRDGLVFQRDHHIVVWDPGSGRTVREPPGAFAVAVGRRRIASCGAICTRLIVADGRRSDAFDAPPRSNFIAGTGAFAPDGAIAAAALAAPANRPKLVLVDVARGESSVVPGVRLGIRGALAWAPAGRQLYYSRPDGRVFVYRPGTSDPQPLGLRFQETVLQLIVAE